MTKIEKVLRVLRFFRLTDDSDNLSLTNVAVLAAIVALVLRPGLDMQSVGIFLTSLVSYQAKRFITPAASPAEDVEELRKLVESLQTKVTALTMSKKMQR